MDTLEQTSVGSQGSTGSPQLGPTAPIQVQVPYHFVPNPPVSTRDPGHPTLSVPVSEPSIPVSTPPSFPKHPNSVSCTAHHGRPSGLRPSPVQTLSSLIAEHGVGVLVTRRVGGTCGSPPLRVGRPLSGSISSFHSGGSYGSVPCPGALDSTGNPSLDLSTT